MSYIFFFGSFVYILVLGLFCFFILLSIFNICYIYIEVFVYEIVLKSLVVRNFYFKVFVIKGCYVFFEIYYWIIFVDVNEIGF